MDREYKQTFYETKNDRNSNEKFENYGYQKKISNVVKNSLIKGEKTAYKFRNRGLTRDKRATVNSVLDNRTLLILKKLKNTFFNEIYGVVSSGKEAFVFNAHKILTDEEIKNVKEILFRYAKQWSTDKREINENTRFGVNSITNELSEFSNCVEINDVSDCKENIDSDENEESFDDLSETESLKINDLLKNTEKRETIDFENNETEIIDIKNEINVFDIVDQLDILIYKDENYISDILENKKIAVSFATKIYNTSILVFKKRSKYIEGEFRFRNAYTKNTNPRKMVKQWSEKEFRNLRRILIHGLRCPYPLVLKSNFIVMSMLGNLDASCLKMKDLNVSILKWKELYIECICILRLLYSICKLVHADFSEYNLLYFYNHIYIIDVSQSMEHDHPHSLEFLKRDCLNITNFFKKKIGYVKHTKIAWIKQLNSMLMNAGINHALKLNDNNEKSVVNNNVISSSNITNTNGSLEINCSNENEVNHTMECDKEPIGEKFSNEDFYNNVQVLPLKKLFEYIVSANLPDPIAYFMENDKKEVYINPLEMLYLELFGTIKNSTPIPKLNYEKIKQNMIYFEKLKRATCYYVTKMEPQNRLRMKKNPNKVQVEEQVFLSSWTPMYLNEIKDIRSIEKDLKLLKKGKSIVMNLKQNYTNNNNNDNYADLNDKNNHDDLNNDICKNYVQRKNTIMSYMQGEDLEISQAQVEENEYLDYEENEIEENFEHVQLSEEFSDEGKAVIHGNENNSSTNDQEEVKFKGIIPEGITRKEWSKLVKEQNREKRKHKIPKYQKKKKKKKAHLKKK
ncbi:serine/threonine protein kinase RIO1, putative [Plasmodium chabaudi chabaudi]|uniref:non-specific serine/threonine protein kinase n=1 Tax=Plasmodium chabaudi chabaudi TaxID=31271 RepID=A0A4V0KD99_PLACU|nr:serine/threonine protein kinase RIO1, putative [Plasmodium chabaudi chabaudi]VTZ71153.1 serine/threonine protein kinase RIO1, putative [Plasmodium chabaudi chabaudi]|eukprot:XP_016655012.1 serine/threonine protein kinase RIO1, putative [Plasmodium chabaudi chabaudi]